MVSKTAFSGFPASGLYRGSGWVANHGLFFRPWFEPLAKAFPLNKEMGLVWVFGLRDGDPKGQGQMLLDSVPEGLQRFLHFAGWRQLSSVTVRAWNGLSGSDGVSSFQGKVKGNN